MLEYLSNWDDAGRTYDNHTASTVGFTSHGSTAGGLGDTLVYGESVGSSPSVHNRSSTFSRVNPGVGTTTASTTYSQSTNSTGTTSGSTQASGSTVTAPTTTGTSGTVSTTVTGSGTLQASGSLGPLSTSDHSYNTVTTSYLSTYHSTLTTTTETSCYSYGTSSDTDYDETFTVTRSTAGTTVTTRSVASDTVSLTVAAAVTTSSRDLRKNAYANTIVRFVSAQFSQVEVGWLPTITAESTTGQLSDVAVSFTDDTTFFASNYFSSRTKALSTSDAAHAILTTGITFASSSGSYHLGYLTAESSLPTARQRLIGTAGLDPSTIAVITAFDTTGYTNSSSTFSSSGLSFSTYTTTRTALTTASVAVLSSFAFNAVRVGEFQTVPEVSRSASAITSTQTTIGYTTWRRDDAHLVAFPTTGYAGSVSITAAGNIRQWTPNVRPVLNSSAPPANTYFLPAPGLGWFGGVDVAGQQSQLARGFSVEMESHLRLHQFDLADLLVGNGTSNHFFTNYVTPIIQQSSISAIFRDPHLAQAKVIYTYDDSSFGFCPVAFETSSTERGMVSVVLRFAPPEATRETTTLVGTDTVSTTVVSAGSVTLSFTGISASAAKSCHQSTFGLAAYGGVQSVSDAQATVMHGTGLRSFTARDSNGSTTGTIFRSVAESSAVENLVFESNCSLYQAAMPDLAGGVVSFALPKFETRLLGTSKSPPAVF